MAYQFLSNLNQDEFDAFASTHPLKNIFQSSKWAQIKREWSALYTGVKENHELVAASLILVRKLPLGFTLFYLPRGPLLDYENKELMTFFFAELKQFAKKHRALSIKIDPNILLSSTPYKEWDTRIESNTSLIQQLGQLGFKHHGFVNDMHASAQPRFAACYYYEGDLDEKLKSTSSYKKIQRAMKYGVYTEEITIDQLDDFCALMQMTESRKNVSLRNKEYFTRLMDVYQEDAYVLISKLNLSDYLKSIQKEKTEIEQQLIATDYKGKQVHNLSTRLTAIEKEINHVSLLKDEEGDIIHISCSLALTDHHTCELLYAGMNERYKRYYGTYYSNYIRMKWGQEMGCVKCNFGGVPGTLDDGLTEFKTGFGVNIDEWIGEFDLPVNRILYPLFERLLPFVRKVFGMIARKRREA